MYKLIKEQIENDDYKLEAMLDKIYTLYAKNKLTKEKMEELETYAREKANPKNSYAPLQEQIENIYNELANIKSRLNNLEQAGTEEPTEPEPVDEYPEYIQPTGAHDAYNTGDKITYNGKKYICKMNGCVWNPNTYPQGWEEVVEETEGAK